ncbi:MAG: hypothetical protein ACREBD_00160 [Blastocatellia bacterium]
MKLRGTGFATMRSGGSELKNNRAIRKRRDTGGGFMLWTILVIALTLALIVIGQMGGTLVHLLLAVATLVLVIQLFSPLFSEDGAAA